MNPILDLLDDLRSQLPAASKVITEGATTEIAQAALTGSIEAVTAAVSALPNTSNHFPSRESYRDVGYAIKAALPDDEPAAFELFSDWCARWTDGENDPDVVAADWRRMKPPYRRGATWLYELAETYGHFDRASVWYEPVPADLGLSLFPEEPPSAPASAKVISFVSLQAAAASALDSSTKPLIKGLLDQGALSVMYGPSNVGKTFVAFSMAFSVSAGLPWGGMKVERGCVVYVAAEGGAGARKRADALCRRYAAESGSADFQLLLSSVDLLRPDADLNALIAAIKDLDRRVVLIVLDTLSRVMAGGEENGSTDMGTLVKHFDKIRQATGAHVMVVHHSGKDQAKGARGHSLLRAATDTEIEIGDGQIAVTKQRDLDKSFMSAFRLDVVELGRDGDGEPVTSCTVELAPRLAATAPLTPTEQVVFEALQVLLTSSGAAKGVRTGELATYLQEAGSDNMSAETVRAHLKNMAKKSAVFCPNRGFWASKSGIPVGADMASIHFEPEENGRKWKNSVFE